MVDIEAIPSPSADGTQCNHVIIKACFRQIANLKCHIGMAIVDCRRNNFIANTYREYRNKCIDNRRPFAWSGEGNCVRKSPASMSFASSGKKKMLICEKSFAYHALAHSDHQSKRRCTSRLDFGRVCGFIVRSRPPPTPNE